MSHTDEPVFQVPAARGSYAWQEGKQFIELPASELTTNELDELSEEEREKALAWLGREQESADG